MLNSLLSSSCSLVVVTSDGTLSSSRSPSHVSLCSQLPASERGLAFPRVRSFLCSVISVKGLFHLSRAWTCLLKLGVSYRNASSPARIWCFNSRVPQLCLQGSLSGSSSHALTKVKVRFNVVIKDLWNQFLPWCDLLCHFQASEAFSHILLEVLRLL